MTGKHRFLKILTAAIGILAGFLLLELSLRLFKYSFVPLVGVTHNPCIYVEDELTGYRFKPNSTGWIHRNFEMDNVVEINSNGFHDIEHNFAKSGIKRNTILAVGDSFTASIHVPISETWTQTLQRELPDTSVINLGLSGTGTDIHLALLTEYLSEHQPDAVILAFFQNDIEDLQRKKRFIDCYNGYVLNYEDQEQKEQLKQYVDQNYPNVATRWLFDRSFTLRIAIRFLLPSGQLLRTNRVSPSSIGIEVPDDPGFYKDLDQLLIEFKKLSEQWDFRLLVIPVPARASTSGSLDAIKTNASPEVLAMLELVDVLPTMTLLRESRRQEHRDLYWKYDGHFNAKGNELFGIAVAKSLGNKEALD